MVQRPELGDRLVEALTAPGSAMVALTAGLHGAGGFGKTRLATWVCHLTEIKGRYRGGLLWVTVGQEVRGTDLAVRINDLAFVLSGRRPAISDPNAAGAELGRLLDERKPVLLVIDDVWEEAQLRPFRIGGPACTRLVTTRIPDLLPDSGPRIPVDAMSADQAREFVADGLAGVPVEIADRLAHLAGRWPVLLNLVNGAVRRRVVRGQSPQGAAEEVAHRLTIDGPTAFDLARPADRSRAVAATMQASLALLDQVDQQRYFDLAIFAEDVDVPLSVLGLLWPGCLVDAFGEVLVGLGLVADYRLDPPGPRLVLHDVIRAYLQARRSATEHAAVHRRLTNAATGLLPRHDGQRPVAWWLLPPDADYLWRNLPYHLQKAGRTGELAAMVCDLRWVEAKTRRSGSVVAVDADLNLVHTPTGDVLQRTLQQAAHLLGPIDPPGALGATLASRLHGIAGLEAILDSYRATLPRPLLEPAWPLPDQPNPDQRATTNGHVGGVRVGDGTTVAVLTGHIDGAFSCGFSPDGTVLATGGRDGTVLLWHVADATQLQVLTGHTRRVVSCEFAPDGSTLATASSDRTARLWRIGRGSTTVLAGHTDVLTGCAFSPDGTLLATSSDDRTVRLWNVASGTVHAVLSGHTSWVERPAFSPDGTLLATGGNDGTIRLWQMSNGTCQCALRLAGPVAGIAWHPGGTILCTVGGAGVYLLNYVLADTV